MIRCCFLPSLLFQILVQAQVLDGLTRADPSHIVEIQLVNFRQRLADRKINLRLSDAAKEWLANMGYDPVYGARPLKRTIQRYVQDPLALKILGGEFTKGDVVDVDANHEGLYFEREKIAG